MRAGRERTGTGHQNQRPSRVAIAGIMKARTTNVSNSSPSPIVVPTCAMIRRSLTTIDAMVSANTTPRR